MSLIILDIDDTLVGSKGFVVWPRPFLKDFFEFCFKNFRFVGIWSAAEREWITHINLLIFQPILKQLEKENEGLVCVFTFIFDREECVIDPFTYESIKPLGKLWKSFESVDINKKNTLIVDDTPHTYSRNPGNAIPIPRMGGFTEIDSEDDEYLLLLIDFLKEIISHFELKNTVENIDKNLWWER